MNLLIRRRCFYETPRLLCETRENRTISLDGLETFNSTGRSSDIRHIVRKFNDSNEFRRNAGDGAWNRSNHAKRFRGITADYFDQRRAIGARTGFPGETVSIVSPFVTTGTPFTIT